MAERQLVAAQDAEETFQQHTKPCSDCPWRRRSLPGWLGDMTPEEWRLVAHGDGRVDCHTLKDCEGAHWQCAGISIYRANVVKRVDAPNLELPRDRKHVFATPMEFIKHHTGPLFPGTTEERA